MSNDDVLDGFKMTDIGFLPNEWEVTQLERFIESPQYGYTARAVESTEGPRYLRITDIQNGIVEWTKVPSCECDASAREKYGLQDGDIVVARIGATTGKSFIFRGSVDTLFASYLIRIRTKESLLPEFLHYFFDTRVYWNQIQKSKGGRLKGGISIPSLRNLVVPIPPLREQKRIATVLNSVQESKKRTDVVVNAAKELKKTLMKHLFTYGPVRMKDATNVELKETSIGQMPKHWKVIPCGELCEEVTVGIVVRPSSYYVVSGVPALRSLNVKEDSLDMSELVFVSEKDNSTRLAKSRLRKGDVLIVRTGYPGTSCVVPEDLEEANCIDLVVVRTRKEVLQSSFLSRYLNSQSGRRQVLANLTGMAQKHLNIGAVRRTLVPIPPLSEQIRIVEWLSVVDSAKKSAQVRANTADTLRRTLLDNLMTGRLRANNLEVPT